jgi:ubiquinone/menaquinone biosynthesis C-methylase UbiE
MNSHNGGSAMQKQVDAKHYDFDKYISKERWAAFYHQLDEITLKKPLTVLEVGVGPGILRLLIQQTINCKYTSIDVDPELKPDLVCSILDIPFEDNSYDVAVCFQVLEHLPYENFEKALSQLFRIAQQAVIISLPDAGKTAAINIPKICKRKLVKWPFKKMEEHEFDGEHYWEINKKNYELRKIIKTMKDIAGKYNYVLEKEYRVWENPYHHFFILGHAGAISR